LSPLDAQLAISPRALICRSVCPGAYAIESVDTVVLFFRVSSIAFDTRQRESAGIQREGESPGCPPAHHLPRGERRSAGESIVTALLNVITGMGPPYLSGRPDGIFDTTLLRCEFQR